VSCEEVAERLVIGRLSKTAPNLDGADVVFPHLAEMSRRHFEIVRASGFHLVRDLNSRNGTLVNDVAVGTEAEGSRPATSSSRQE
jgi:pSer/pThr/pTyr-binding forkhead associated (FHA) protein